ncbi:MAG TPA: exodeoxyribonuclease VII large subunit [Candidatus Acidoferrum sp.]|jgi:exodeoxyribonuclease VII large subunit|nr:exodeoxyribonuclease VII large subunit [Candidatus Acidoferrum sp.]
MSQLQFNLQPERRVFSVSELTGRIRDVLARAFTDIWVQGEISNCRAAQSGHIYCTLKDDRAQLKCVCFKSQLRLMKFRPEDGLHVTARGSISVYENRGEYQFYIDSMEPVGAGALQVAFEQLKKRLEAEGLFSPERKKPLPLLPGRIGLVTSPRGAAVRDVVGILRRRFHTLHLILYPVRVQGEGAAGEIVRAIRYFQRHNLVDVIILARGGGSLEDLWSFNEEEVARAIAACSIPIISGVGHETDFTIADFVADVRASTPSAAAELVVQTRAEFDKHVAALRSALAEQMRYRVLVQSRRVHELSGSAGFRRLHEMLRQLRQRSDELAGRLAHALRSQMDLSRRRYQFAHLRIRSTDLRTRLSGAQRKTSDLTTRLGFGLAARLEVQRKRFGTLQLRLGSTDLHSRIDAIRLRIENRTDALAARAERYLRYQHERLTQLRVQLAERSPATLLERGYAIATDVSGQILRDSNQVAIGDTVSVKLFHGRLLTELRQKQPD